MIDEDARRCVVDLCAVLEVILKSLQQALPYALAMPATIEHDPVLGEKFISEMEAASQLGMFRAFQDGLSVVSQIKNHDWLGASSEKP